MQTATSALCTIIIVYRELRGVSIANIIFVEARSSSIIIIEREISYRLINLAWSRGHVSEPTSGAELYLSATDDRCFTCSLITAAELLNV